MINEIKNDADKRMDKSIESLNLAFARMRTGRAHASLLDHVKVSYYGSEVPLSQAASITVSDARTLSITPWEKNLVQDIEKAIMKSDIGVTPSTAGNVIRIVMPPLTEERRKEIIKIAKSEAESARVAIRNIRRDANSDVKDLLKEKEISEDEAHQAEDLMQKLTDSKIQKIEKILAAKESELMQI